MKTLTNNGADIVGFHSRMTRLGAATILFTLFLLIATSVTAQSYRGGKSAVQAGGGTSRGGDYEIKGSIGLTKKSPALKNQDYALNGGVLIMFTAVQSPEAPRLNIAVTATNTVVITWAAAAPDYLLEQNGDAITAAWSNVGLAPVANGENQQVILPITPGNKFFRLRKP